MSVELSAVKATRSLFAKLRVYPHLIVAFCSTFLSYGYVKRATFRESMVYDGLPIGLLSFGVHLTFYGVFEFAERLGQSLSRTRIVRLPTRALYLIGPAIFVPIMIGTGSFLTRAFADWDSHPSLVVYWFAAEGGLGIGGLSACFWMMASSAGFGSILKPLIFNTRRIVTLRKFHSESQKITLEHVLGTAVNHFGEFTIIEAPGEYARLADAAWAQPPNVEIDAIAVHALPVPMPWFPNFFELWLGQSRRLKFKPAEWRERVLEELRQSCLAVVDVSEYSDNVMWEIEHAAELMPSHLIFVAVDEGTVDVSLSRYRREMSIRGVSLELSPIIFRVPSAPLTHDNLVASNLDAMRLVMRQIATRDSHFEARHWLITGLVWTTSSLFGFAIAYWVYASRLFAVPLFALGLWTSAHSRMKRVFVDHEPLQLQ